MFDGDESLVTREMIAVFVLFGAELVPVVVIFGAVGIVPWAVSVLVVAGIALFFAGWLFLRWRTLRSDEDDTTDPVETLKRRYAEGEISEAEFERKLDHLMDTDETDHDTARERITDRSSN